MTITGRSRVTRLAWSVAAGACLLATAPAAMAQDPFVADGSQEWLRRVVPAGLTPPAQIPPIAIIEDGFDATHPETQGGWVTQRRPSPVPDPSDPDAVRAAAEGIAHGTAVASVIGAPRNGVGIEGVLPGTRVWVYGSTPYCRDVAAAVRTAVRDGAKVINMSIGFQPEGACVQLRDAVSWAYGRGVLTVASAGNNRANQRWTQPGSDWHVVTVGALNHLDQVTSFSQQNIAMDVTAPGEDILLAVPVTADTDDGVADGYTRWDGTSFSAPIVAAAAAWVMAARPDLTASQVADVLRYSARDLGAPGWGRAYGWGALNLAGALTEEAPFHDPFEPNEDIRWVSGRAGFTPDPPLLGNRRRQTLRARLDLAEDPFDVYRVKVPVGRTVRITLDPGSMAMDLFVFQPSARFVGQRGTLVARSTRRGIATETVTITNRGATMPAYLEVRGLRGRSLGSNYDLTLQVVR